MINSSLCYMEQDGNYLMLHRIKKENDLNRDKWIGVGGKFMSGESPEDCLLREVREETGLSLKKWRFRGIVTFDCPPWDTEYMHLFTASDWTGELIECDEGRLEWVEKSAVLSLPIWEGDRIFLRLLSQDEPFFSLKLSYRDGKLVAAVLNGRDMEI